MPLVVSEMCEYSSNKEQKRLPALEHQMRMANELIELNERASKLRDYIKRNPRYCSGEKSALKDVEQLIAKCKASTGPAVPEESQDGVVY
jgi:hypothetical protein